MFRPRLGFYKQQPMVGAWPPLKPGKENAVCAPRFVFFEFFSPPKGGGIKGPGHFRRGAQPETMRHRRGERLFASEQCTTGAQPETMHHRRGERPFASVETKEIDVSVI